MKERDTWKQSLATAASIGVVTGAALTLVILHLLGVRLQPGLSTPAFNRFFSAYSDLTKSYYFPISQGNLLDGAISGMTKALDDPFTDYFTPTAANQFKNYLSNSFDGIGVVLESSGGNFVVVSVTPNSPAQKAGLMPHDVIASVNGKVVQGLNINQVSQLILGRAGSKVLLTVSRPGHRGPLSFTVTRAKITAPTVSSRMLPNHLGYLAISVIGAHTSDEVASALTRLQNQGATRLIIDLRGNGGGYLDQAELIANQLIPAGKIVVETQSRGQSPVPIRSKGPGLKLPMVVLIDKNTASAAEVLAAALHDDVGAGLVGTVSYGKGTVQQTQTYPDGSALKYTVARWLTPTGFWVQHKGLTPTTAVALPSYVFLPSMLQLRLPLQSGQNTSDVAVLQKALRAVGLRVDRTDGYFDTSTKLAVLQFQQLEGLPPTGIVDSRTANALQSTLDRVIQNSDTQLQKAEQVALAEKPGVGQTS